MGCCRRYLTATVGGEDAFVADAYRVVADEGHARLFVAATHCR